MNVRELENRVNNGEVAIMDMESHESFQTVVDLNLDRPKNKKGWIVQWDCNNLIVWVFREDLVPNGIPSWS